MTFSNKSTLTALALAISTALLSACGGGGSGGSSSSSTASGFAVDGPLSGATVTCGSQVTTTDNQGNFSFPLPCTTTLTITGGVDTTTGLLFAGSLKAPASSITSSIAVTPITTLIAAVGTDKADEILTALGLPANTNLFTANPMLDKNLLAKTTAVQELVDGISESLSQLGGNTTPDSLNQAVVSAVANKLASGAPISLSNTTFLTDVIKTSVNNVAADLPQEQKDNIASVADNIAAISASIISGNVSGVESAIQSIPNFSSTNPQSNVNAALQVKNLIIDRKDDVTSQNVINLLKDLITESGISSQLESISNAILNENTNAITSALNTIAETTGTALPESLSESLSNASQFTSDYFYFGTVTVDGKRYTPNEIAQSFVTPIVTNTLDNVLLDVATGGTYANSSQKFKATLKVDASDRSILIHANDLRMQFSGNGMVSDSAFLPAGSMLTVVTKTTTGTFVSSEITLNRDINVSSGVNLALNSTTLGAISSSLKTAFDELNSQNGTSTFTAVISPFNDATVATEYTQGQLTFANEYSLALGEKTFTGFGLKARVTVKK